MNTYLTNKSIEELITLEELKSLNLKDWDSLLTSLWGKTLYKHLIKVLKSKIEQYDSSEEVNSFLINGNKFWLDKATRVGLMHLANCSTDTLQLVLGNQILTIPVDMAKQFLAQLEVYAGKCYLQTQKHLLALKDLRTIDDIMNYDFTAGYPEKLSLNL